MDGRREKKDTLGVYLLDFSKNGTKAGEDEIRFALSRPFILTKKVCCTEKIIFVGKHIEQKLPEDFWVWNGKLCSPFSEWLKVWFNVFILTTIHKLFLGYWQIPEIKINLTVALSDDFRFIQFQTTPKFNFTAYIIWNGYWALFWRIEYGSLSLCWYCMCLCKSILYTLWYRLNA